MNPTGVTYVPDPEPADTVYTGVRNLDGTAWVRRNGRPFLPNESQRVYNHSPTGFEWGYAGSGPAQLALALLLDATSGNRITALDYHQDFKRARVGGWEYDGWRITRVEIVNWLSSRICPPLPRTEPKGGDS